MSLVNIIDAEIVYVNKMEKKANGILFPILRLMDFTNKCRRLWSISCFSDSLLFNFTNNAAEFLNAIICKDIGGKRINFGLQGWYNGRVAGVGVQYNTQQVLTEYHASMHKIVPPIVGKLEKRQVKVAKTKEAREVKGRTRALRRSQRHDKHGPNSQKLDIEPESYQQLRDNHLKKLRKRRVLEAN